jgi:hypothetical protein
MADADLEGRSHAPLLADEGSRGIGAHSQAALRHDSGFSDAPERRWCDMKNMVIIPEQDNTAFAVWEVSVLLLLLLSAYFVPFDVFILQEPEPGLAYSFNRFLDCVFLSILSSIFS